MKLLRERREYTKPSMKVYELQYRQQLLVGSQGSRGIDFEWEDTTP